MQKIELTSLVEGMSFSKMHRHLEKANMVPLRSRSDSIALEPSCELRSAARHDQVAGKVQRVAQRWAALDYQDVATLSRSCNQFKLRWVCVGRCAGTAARGPGVDLGFFVTWTRRGKVQTKDFGRIIEGRGRCWLCLVYDSIHHNISARFVSISFQQAGLLMLNTGMRYGNLTASDIGKSDVRIGHDILR